MFTHHICLFRIEVEDDTTLKSDWGWLMMQPRWIVISLLQAFLKMKKNCWVIDSSGRFTESQLKYYKLRLLCWSLYYICRLTVFFYYNHDHFLVWVCVFCSLSSRSNYICSCYLVKLSYSSARNCLHSIPYQPRYLPAKQNRDSLW